MNRFRIFLAVFACKASARIIRLMGKGGTDRPGKLALKICPSLLAALSAGVKTVIVVGTNGKTTTCRMIEAGVSAGRGTLLANRSGANLFAGITTCFAEASTLSGRCRREYAVIECDEAAFRLVTKQLKPEVVVLTNLFRDQLDRYGDVAHTLELIADGIRSVPEATLCLNADCSMSCTLKGELPNRILTFGVDVPLSENARPELSDAIYCAKCRAEYEYDYVTFGHLGGFRCPSCGYFRESADCSAKKVVSQDGDGTTITLGLPGRELEARINLPGAYNIYNAVACAAALYALGFGDATILAALADFRCGFGRMEKLAIGRAGTRMILIKNPAGANQAMNYVLTTARPALLVLALNDNVGDGKDVSWIYDADFERLFERHDRLAGLVVTGRRAEEMGLRLKYAGFADELITVQKDYNALLDMLDKRTEPVFILPNYTSMMELRSKIAKRCGLKEFWEQ